MKKLIPILVLAAAIGFGIGTYFFRKGHDNTADEVAAFSMTADNIVQAFLDDETGSTEKFKDKVIEISGPVLDIVKENSKVISIKISSDELYVVNCTFQEPLDAENIASNIKVKGVFSGFKNDSDMMLPNGTLELARTVIVK